MERAKRRLGEMIDFCGTAEEKFGGEARRETLRRAVTDGDRAALDVLDAVMNLLYHEGDEESTVGQEWVTSAITILQDHAEYLDERSVESSTASSWRSAATARWCKTGGARCTRRRWTP